MLEKLKAQYTNLELNSSCNSDFESPIAQVKKLKAPTSDDDDDAKRRSIIEKQLMSMDKLFGGDDSSSEESDGDSFCNEHTPAQFDVARRIEERKRVQEKTDLKQLWQSQLNNVLVDTTPSSTETEVPAAAAAASSSSGGGGTDYKQPLKKELDEATKKSNNDQLSSSTHSTRGVQSHSVKSRPPLRRSLSGDCAAGKDRGVRRTLSGEGLKSMAGSAHNTRARPSIKRAGSLRRKMVQESVDDQIEAGSREELAKIKQSLLDTSARSKHKDDSSSSCKTSRSSRTGGDAPDDARSKLRDRRRSRSPTAPRQQRGGAEGELDTSTSQRRQSRSSRRQLGSGSDHSDSSMKAKSPNDEGDVDSNSPHKRQSRVRRDTLSRSDHGDASKARRANSLLSHSEHRRQTGAPGSQQRPKRGSSHEGLRPGKSTPSARPPRRRCSFDEMNPTRRLRGSDRIHDSSSDDSSANSKNAKWDTSSSLPKQRTSAPTSTRSLQNGNDLRSYGQESWEYTSCLAMMNAGREKVGLDGLARDIDLDAEAQKHAQAIAESDGNNVAEWIDYPGHVIRGASVVSIHAKVLDNESSSKARVNILHPNYRSVGIGIAKGNDGTTTYVCELFRGKYAFVLEDTEE